MTTPRLSVTFSFDETYQSQFLTVVNNIINTEVDDNVCLLCFYVCYNGSHDSMKLIQQRANDTFPQVEFYFKHIPLEYPVLEDFLCAHYPYKKSRQTLQTCSVYYRLFLDLIWPELEGLVLHLDLDLMIKSPLSKMFLEAVKISQTTKSKPALFVVPYPRRECWDLKNHTLVNQLWTEWVEVRGSMVLQDYVNTWAEEAYPILHNFSSGYQEQYNMLIHKNLNTTTATHFNAGVLLFNLTDYRTRKLSKACELCVVAQRYTKIFAHNDQGILNFVFFNDVGKLHPNWNCCDFGYGSSWVLNGLSHKTYLEQGHIIHCNGEHKPWNADSLVADSVRSLWKQFEIT